MGTDTRPGVTLASAHAGALMALQTCAERLLQAETPADARVYAMAMHDVSEALWNVHLVQDCDDDDD